MTIEESSLILCTDLFVTVSKRNMQKNRHKIIPICDNTRIIKSFMKNILLYTY